MPHSVDQKVEASPSAEVEMAGTATDEGANQPAAEDVDMTDASQTQTLGATQPEEKGADGADKQKGANGTASGEGGGVKLENLFDDLDSDDEEFPSSAMPAKKEVSNSPDLLPSSPPNVGQIQHSGSDPELLRTFYQRLFPWRYFFQWLNHSPQPTLDFEHRELSFMLSNDAVMRYQSYRTSDMLRKDVLRLMPTRIEIGPVYSSNPRERKLLGNAAGFRPVSKELCFDIDLTDYDDIRTCCDKANICIKCWQFMTMAIKVINAALRDDFGFKHIMWVYSGRRGIHAWISDKSARTLEDSKRRVIAGYLEVIVGGAQSGKRVNLRRPLHPHIARSMKLLKPHFYDDVLEGQDPWKTPERAEKLLKMLPENAQLREGLKRKWDASPGRSSSLKWQDIERATKTATGSDKKTKALRKSLEEAQEDIMLEYTYPRLDINVSKKLNHLLKSPFVIHPGTGRVCVPVSPRRFEDFDPFGVPTIQQLIHEIDAWQEPEIKSEKAVPDWEKTSLKPYIDYFRAHVNAIMRDELGVKVKRERDGGDMNF